MVGVAHKDQTITVQLILSHSIRDEYHPLQLCRRVFVIAIHHPRGHTRYHAGNLGQRSHAHDIAQLLTPIANGEFASLQILGEVFLAVRVCPGNVLPVLSADHP
jgi:hypothetical protein